MSEIVFMMDRWPSSKESLGTQAFPILLLCHLQHMVSRVSVLVYKKMIVREWFYGHHLEKWYIPLPFTVHG